MNAREGGIEPHPETERQRLAKHFHQVASTYARIRSLSPITGVNPDPDAAPNQQLNAATIEYAVDVEAATKKALDNDPNLLKQWETLAFQEGQVSSAETITRRCGGIYEKRKLLPNDYFRHVRRGVPGIPRVPLPASSTPKAVEAAA